MADRDGESTFSMQSVFPKAFDFFGQCVLPIEEDNDDSRVRDSEEQARSSQHSDSITSSSSEIGEEPSKVADFMSIFKFSSENEERNEGNSGSANNTSKPTGGFMSMFNFTDDQKREEDVATTAAAPPPHILRPSTLAIIAACEEAHTKSVEAAPPPPVKEEEGFFSSMFNFSSGNGDGRESATSSTTTSKQYRPASLHMSRNDSPISPEDAEKSAAEFFRLVWAGVCCPFDDGTNQVQEGAESSAPEIRLPPSRRSSAEARELLRYYKVVVVAVLFSSIAFPIADTYSDISVCIQWLTSKDVELREYGWISLGLLFGSLVPMAIFMYYIETNCKKDRRWDPKWGCLLSFSFLRMPVSAICDSVGIILKDKVVKSDLEGLPSKGGIVDTRGIDTQKRFLRGLGGSSILRLFELVCESTLQLMLQSYVVTWRHFKYGERPDVTIIFSIVVSLLTLAFGLVSLYASRSNMIVQVFASVHVFFLLVVRFAVHAALFVKFGHVAVCFVFVALVARLAFFGHFTNKFGLKWANPNDPNDTMKGKFMFGALTMALTYFAPISTDEIEYFDEIATSGPIRSVAYFNRFFSGRRSKVLLCIHAAEATVCWVFVLSLPHENARAGVTPIFALIWGAVPAVASLAFFLLAKNKDDRYQAMEKEAQRKMRRRSERFPTKEKERRRSQRFTAPVPTKEKERQATV
jgi:hypothetical protein